jgi:type IV secretory pathway VirB2 component (pilin)
MSVNFLSNIKRNQMKKIKNFAKKLFSAKRMKTLAMLLFCGTLATYAQNAAGDYTAGTDALATVTEEIAKYVPFVVKLCYAIAGVVAVVGAISVYIAMNNEEQDVKKKIMMIVGACIFLVAAAQALPLFFGVTN